MTLLAVTRGDVADYVGTLILVYTILMIVWVILSWIPLRLSQPELDPKGSSDRACAQALLERQPGRQIRCQRQCSQHLGDPDRRHRLNPRVARTGHHLGEIVHGLDSQHPAKAGLQPADNADCVPIPTAGR